MNLTEFFSQLEANTPEPHLEDVRKLIQDERSKLELLAQEAERSAIESDQSAFFGAMQAFKEQLRTVLAHSASDEMFHEAMLLHDLDKAYVRAWETLEHYGLSVEGAPTLKQVQRGVEQPGVLDKIAKLQKPALLLVPPISREDLMTAMDAHPVKNQDSTTVSTDIPGFSSPSSWDVQVVEAIPEVPEQSDTSGTILEQVQRGVESLGADNIGVLNSDRQYLMLQMLALQEDTPVDMFYITVLNGVDPSLSEKVICGRWIDDQVAFKLINPHNLGGNLRLRAAVPIEIESESEVTDSEENLELLKNLEGLYHQSVKTLTTFGLDQDVPSWPQLKAQLDTPDTLAKIRLIPEPTLLLIPPEDLDALITALDAASIMGKTKDTYVFDKSHPALGARTAATWTWSIVDGRASVPQQANASGTNKVQMTRWAAKMQQQGLEPLSTARAYLLLQMHALANGFSLDDYSKETVLTVLNATDPSLSDWVAFGSWNVDQVSLYEDFPDYSFGNLRLRSSVGGIIED